MTQSRAMSLVETLCSTFAALVVALVTQILVFPLYGIDVTLGENISLCAIFTLVSIVRGYIVRRVFNWVGKS